MKVLCEECYSEDNRITPLLNPNECLKNHNQYICSTCGRCICIEKDQKRGLYRWNFPFKSVDIAKLYLRTAEVVCKDICGIYEIIGKNGRISYKIFHTIEDLELYLTKNKDKRCMDKRPSYISKEYIQYPKAIIKKLTGEEIIQYIEER